MELIRFAQVNSASFLEGINESREQQSDVITAYAGPHKDRIIMADNVYQQAHDTQQVCVHHSIKANIVTIVVLEDSTGLIIS